MKIANQKIVSNSIWLLVLQVFNMIVPIVTLPYITRVLEPAGYGMFSLALNWITYFQVFVEYGFGYSGARRATESNGKKLQQLYSAIITARIILLLIVFFILNLLLFARLISVNQFICMIILFFMIIGTAFQLTWLFQGMQDMKYITVVNAGARLLSTVLIFLFVKNENHLYLYCFLYSSTFIFSSWLGLIIAKKRYGLRVSLVTIGKAIVELEEGWSFFISQVMSKVLSGMGITVLGIVATIESVGLYSAIYKIPYVVVILFGSVSQAIYPNASLEFSKSQSHGLEYVKGIMKLVVPVFILLTMVIIGMRGSLVRLVLGEMYVEYSNLIIPLCIWMLFSIINNFLGIQILVGSGRQKEYSRVFTTCAIVSILLNWGMGMWFNLYGIAWATCIAEGCLFCGLIRKINYCFSISRKGE